VERIKSNQLLFDDHLPPIDSGDEGDFCCPAPPAAPAENRASLESQVGERRRHFRYGCAGTARIWASGNEVEVSGQVSEISLGGCFIEAMSPEGVGTLIRLVLEIKTQNIGVEGVVRFSQPACGMGVEFTRMKPAEAEKLHRVVAELSGPTIRSQAANNGFHAVMRRSRSRARFPRYINASSKG
jgi:hypothetical protein